MLDGDNQRFSPQVPVGNLNVRSGFQILLEFQCSRLIGELQEHIYRPLPLWTMAEHVSC
jgi:hypothetical protein